MKVLVINGDCITTNSSANLCHLAYIRGLVDSGYDVTLLSADGRDYVCDESMVIPKEVKHYTYYGVSFYEKMSLKKKKNSEVNVSQAVEQNSDNKEFKSFKSVAINKAKELLLSFYGVHGIYAKFVKKANKFKSDEEFDYVLSISTPVTSHLITHNLLKSKHITAKKWIQIWEDPWYSDAYGFNGKDKIYKEEKRLLSFAQRVCYVSPLTLANQKKLFPESSDKMYWEPLPFYYKNSTVADNSNGENRYGYFGNYYPASRDLQPFYLSAKESGVKTNICGDPSNLFGPTDNISIYQRLPLEKLNAIEDKTNVLIFLCNKKGGQIPGKIYQYSATNKTILFILDGTDEEKKVIKEYFEPFNRYVFCENTVQDITRAINQIESNDLGNISNAPIDAFNPQTTIKKILEG